MLKSKGFTLVELAIVIVIIGLLVGGVLAGQELIKQSQIASTIKKMQQFSVADSLFKDKYKCIPGDCSKARTFFGNTAPDGNAVNNGDGDTMIGTGSTESAGFMQHLSLAKFIKGSFSGLTGDVNPPGGTINAEKMDINGGFFTARNYSIWGVNSLNAIQLGKTYAGLGYMANQAVLSSQDAYTIDKKADDGLANSGKLYCVNPNCSTVHSTTPPGADYVLGSSDALTCTCVYFYDK